MKRGVKSYFELNENEKAPHLKTGCSKGSKQANRDSRAWTAWTARGCQRAGEGGGGNLKPSLQLKH